MGLLQTDLIQKYLMDPKVIAGAAGLVIIVVILLVVLILRRARRTREEREFLEGDLAARERAAQFEAAVNAIPYSQDPADAARGVAQVLGQYQQVRVLAVYAGRQGYQRLTNILRQSPAGTGSLARPILAPWIDAHYAATHDRPQFVPRNDFIDAAVVGQKSVQETEAARPRSPVAPPAPVVQPHQEATPGPPPTPTGTGSEITPLPAAATTTPLDTAAESLPVPETAGPGRGAETGSPAGHSQPGPTGAATPPARGTGPLGPGRPNPRGTGPLVGATQPESVSGSDSRSVGVLPWHGLFGWRGLLVIESREPIDLEGFGLLFQSHDQLANRISIALELERGITAAGSATDQSSRIVEFLRSAVEGISSRPALTETVKQVADLLASDSAAFWALDSKAGVLKMIAAHGISADGVLPVPMGKGLSGWVAEHRELLAVEDAPADPKCLFPNEARESGIGSYLGVPVFSEDQVEGVLEVHNRQPHPWGPTSISALRSAAIALSAINRGVAEQPPQSGLKAESAYMTMSQTLESLESRDEVIEAAVSVLGHALGVSRVIAIEKGGQTGYLNSAVIKHEYRDPEVPSTLGAMMPEEFSALLFQGEGERPPVVINDSGSGSPMPRETVARLHICSELMVSLMLNQSVTALIDIQECGQPREWTRDEIEFAEKLAHQASVVITHLAVLDKAARDLEAARLDARRAVDVATRARGIVDSVPEAIIGLDRDGRLTFFNAPGRVRYKLKNEDLGRMVGMVESLTLSDESIWEKVNASHGIVRFEATIAAPRTAAPLAAPDRSAARARNAVSLPISIAVAPVRSEKDEITGRILVLTDLSHTRSHSKKDTGEHVAALEAKMKETEEALSEANRVIENAAAADAATGRVAYVAGEIEKVRTDEARARRAAQQLLEINRLKSDFIVNAGRELDASLQSVLGFAELLGQGQYGQVTPEQLEAIKGIYAWARRMKNDVDWLIEYGSARSRTLESADETAAR